MALYRSAGRTAEFENIGRNVVVASRSGLVETRPWPTILVAFIMGTTAEKNNSEVFVSLQPKAHGGLLSCYG